MDLSGIRASPAGWLSLNFGEKSYCSHKKCLPTTSPSPNFFLSRHGEHCSNYCSISKKYPPLKDYPVE